jgi:hypothetical protein
MLSTFLVSLALFAQRGGGGEDAAAAMFGVCLLSFYLVVVVGMIAGMWATFAKAGEPGWAAIVPIYNVIVLAKIGGKDPLYGLLCLIPIVGIIFLIMILIEVANKFGRGGAFVVGLILLPFIFWPILGFGSAQYHGRGGRRSRSRYDDDDDDRPRRSRSRDDDDDDDRPRRRPSRDEDDDRIRKRRDD